MLSPHEFATLLLLEGAPDSVDLNSEDLAVLVERQLVALERLASGCQRLQLTADGQSILRAAARIQMRLYRPPAGYVDRN